MSRATDTTRVAVLSRRQGVDLVVSVWVDGYTGRRFGEPEPAVAYAGNGGVLLVDERDCDRVLRVIGTRAGSPAVVCLAREATDTTVDLDRGVVIASAGTVPDLTRALDQAVGMAREAPAHAQQRPGRSGTQANGRTRAVRDSVWTATRPPQR